MSNDDLEHNVEFLFYSLNISNCSVADFRGTLDDYRKQNKSAQSTLA